MIIAVGTENAAKLDAIKIVVEKCFDDVSIVPKAAESGVRDQPLSNDEGIEGALNRAKSALNQVKSADLGIGMEGVVSTNQYGMFLLGWVVVVDGKGKVGIGSSGAVQLPDSMRAYIDGGGELGPYVQKLMADEQNEIRKTQGTNGILTGGMYTRVDEFVHATQTALAPFLRPDLYANVV